MAAVGGVSFMPGMDVAPTPAQPASPMIDLLGFGGDEPAPAVVVPSPLELSPVQTITQESFQVSFSARGEDLNGNRRGSRGSLSAQSRDLNGSRRWR